MKKALLSLAPLFTLLSACSTDYVAQCQEMYSRINELDCMIEINKFDLDTYCPESYNTSGYDYEEFFACVEKHITCEEGTLVNNVASCMEL